MIDILNVFLSTFLKVFNIPVFTDTFKTATGEFPIVSVSFGSLAIFSIIITIIFTILFRTAWSDFNDKDNKSDRRLNFFNRMHNNDSKF